MWRLLVTSALIITATCAGCQSTAGGAGQDVLATGNKPSATAAPVVTYEGREPFEHMAPETPALPAVTAGPVIQREAWALAFFAVGASEGQVVADIGCGKGRFAFDLARAVGDEGLVYCRDTSTYKLDDFRDRMAAEGVSNIDLALSEKGDVVIPAGTIDVALLSDVYVYVLKQPETKGAFLDSIRSCLKPGGVVGVVHVRSGHLTDDEKRKHVHQQTIDDFVAHGFEPGRRLVFARVQTSMPGEILEFRRPE